MSYHDFVTNLKYMRADSTYLISISFMTFYLITFALLDNELEYNMLASKSPMRYSDTLNKKQENCVRNH